MIVSTVYVNWSRLNKRLVLSMYNKVEVQDVALYNLINDSTLRSKVFFLNFRTEITLGREFYQEYSIFSSDNISGMNNMNENI